MIRMIHTYTFELDDVDAKFAEACAKEIGCPLGEIAKEAVLEYMEDFMDARAADKAWEEYQANPVTYTHEEVGRRLGLIQ